MTPSCCVKRQPQVEMCPMTLPGHAAGPYSTMIQRSPVAPSYFSIVLSYFVRACGFQGSLAGAGSVAPGVFTVFSGKAPGVFTGG